MFRGLQLMMTRMMMHWLLAAAVDTSTGQTNWFYYLTKTNMFSKNTVLKVYNATFKLGTQLVNGVAAYY